MTLVAGVLGAVFGAVGVLAFGSRHDPEGAKIEAAMAVAHGDEAAPEPNQALPSVAGPAPQPAEGANLTSASRKRRHVRVIVQNAPAPLEATPAPVAEITADAAKPGPSVEPPKARKTAQKNSRKRGREREPDQVEAQSAYATPYGSGREYSYGSRQEYSYGPRPEYPRRDWGGWAW